MMRYVRILGGWFLAAAFTAFLLIAFGHFSIVQSVLLVLLFPLSILAYDRKQSVQTFTPFFVQVVPNWTAILKDFGLASTDEELQAFFERTSVYEKEREDAALFRGFTFTVLGPQLVFWNRRLWLYRRIDFRLSIFPLTHSNVPFTPNFYFQQKADGIRIGISTPESSKRGGFVRQDEMEVVTIATLPWVALTQYYGGEDPRPEKRQQDLEKQGWTEEAPDFDFREFPCELKHKYCSVHHAELQPFHYGS
jgi:hypothetical protein